MANTDWLTLALVVITAFYAWATLKILRANEAMVATMRSQQDAAMRPYVQVSPHLRIGTQLIYMTIENVGKTAATNLRLSIDRDFFQLGEKRAERNIANSVAFSSQIDSLPPGSRLLFLLGTGPSLYGDKKNEELSPLTFKITAMYQWQSDSTTEESVMDLRPYINTDVPHEPIVEELKKLRGEIRELRNLRK